MGLDGKQMWDLNATMFYKAKFTLSSQDPSADLLWALVLEVRRWLCAKHNRNGRRIVTNETGKWTQFKRGGKLFDEEHENRIFAKSQYYASKEDSSCISWACKIVEKPVALNNRAPREWVTEIGYESTEPGTAEISYVVTYSDAAGFIGELDDIPGISLPNVIRVLINNPQYTCRIGDTVLRTDPIKLEPGDFPAFQDFLFSENRTIPVVYISPRRVDLDSDEVAVLVSPEKLATCIAANGLVYYSDSLDFSHEMWYLGNDRYTCSGGAIRLYRPSINTEERSDQYRHRVIPADFILDWGADCIYEIFRRALAQDVHFYETMFRLENCEALFEKERYRERIQSIKREKDGEVDNAYEEWINEYNLRMQTEAALQKSKEEVNCLKEDKFNLETRASLLMEKASQSDAMKAACERIREISEYPATPVQIARYFETVYPERIAFTERAYHSLETCTTRADYLWEALYYMATVLCDQCQLNPAQAYKAFTEQTGWECSRGNGHQTRNNAKLMRQYVDTYNGQEINIEAHIKKGTNDRDPKSIRIYFAYDPQVADKILIGHCGKHLENATSRKIK